MTDFSTKNRAPASPRRTAFAAAIPLLSAAPASALAPCVTCGGELYGQTGAAIRPAIETGAAPYAEPGLRPGRGVIAFRHPALRELTQIFRLVGLPEDEIRLQPGGVILNGVWPRQHLPDHAFLPGGNRDNAFDSRYPVLTGGPGMILIANILGPVVGIENP